MDLLTIDSSKMGLLSPEDATKLRALNELSEVIVRLKEGIDHEVNALVAIPIEVKSEADLHSIAERIREGRNTIDNVKARHAAVREFSHQLHKVVCAQEKQLTDLAEGWIRNASRAMASFNQAESLRRAEEQRQLQQKLDQEHDKTIEKQARKLERSGEAGAADQLREQAKYVRPVAYVPPVAAPDKTQMKQDFDFEVTNDNEVPRMWCAPDLKKIAKHVKNLGKDAIDSIPGVRVFPKDATAVVRR